MRDRGDILAHIGDTPLVPLARLSAGLPVPVLVKCEHLNPGGSIKDRIARAIVDDAERRGALTPGATLIEATAGNTGLGLALVAAVRGYQLVCVMPEKMSSDKREALAAVGARVIVTANAPPSHPDNFRNVARRLAATHGWFLTDQFDNPANVTAHAETTAVELLAQTNGRIGAFVAGAGTGGTISGVGHVLRQAFPDVKIIAVEPATSAVLSGGKPSPHRLQGIGAGFIPKNLDRDLLTEVRTVGDRDAYQAKTRLAREEGLLVGISAGAAVHVALQVAAELGPQSTVVTVLCDTGERYFSLDEYFA